MKKKIVVFCLIFIVCVLSACQNQRVGNVQNQLGKDNAVLENQLEIHEKEKMPQSEYLMPEKTESVDDEYWNVISNSIKENVIPIDADIIYSYGNIFAGETVLTAFKVSDTMYDLIRYIAPHNKYDSFVSIVAKFENREDMEFVEVDDVVAVMGVIEKSNHEERTTVTIKNCQMIAVGVDAQIIKEEIKLKNKEQKEYAKSKGAVEPGIPLPAEMPDDEYKRNCKEFYVSKVVDEYKNSFSISFNKYNEAKAVFDGTIIQTIVLSEKTNAYLIECEEQCWYVVHTTNEIEKPVAGKKLRFYGECIGINEYVTVNVEKKTIPVIKLKYFDIL